MTIKNLRIVIILLALSLLLCGCKAEKKDAVNTPAAETTSVATPEPAAETKPAATPEPEPEPEPEPLPSTNVTFVSEAEAEQAMKQFYEDNTVLLNALAQEMKSFYRIQDGYLYEKASYYSSWRPVNETPSGEKKTEAIEAFLALPDAEDYDVWWRDTEPRMFVISCRWYNDEGYYSTTLQFFEEGAWGISTSCWRKATKKGSLNYVAGKERRISTKEMIEADDGFSGVGTVRGNTNGNLRNGGRALSDGTYIYYIDQTVAHLRLCRYTLATGEIKTLWDLKEVDRRDAGWLNLAPDGSLIYAEQGTDHAEVKISHYRALHYLCKFPRINALYVVYDCIVIDVGGKTVICDMDGNTLNEIEGFSVDAVMGGVLYGRKDGSDNVYAYNLYGRFLKVYPKKSGAEVYAANGYLIAVELDPADETTVLTLLNVYTDKSETYRTGLTYATVENLSKEGVYLKENGYRSVGPIWLLSWYGTGPECFDSRLYDLGPSLWDDTFLNDFVPCDATADDPNNTEIGFRIRDVDAFTAGEGYLFACDFDGDGTEEAVSFRTGEDGTVVVRIGGDEYPLSELDRMGRLSRAILLQPDPASENMALVLTTYILMGDWNETAILLLDGKTVRESKYVFGDAFAYLSDGKLRMTQRCWLLGTYYGSRAYVGPDLTPESEWYETGAAERVRELSREKQIEFNWLFKAIRDVPCTIDGNPAVIEAGTWMYLLRWKDTDDYAEIMTEDGRIALLAFTPEYDQYLDGTKYVKAYLFDGVDAESYFENLCMAG